MVQNELENSDLSSRIEEFSMSDDSDASEDGTPLVDDIFRPVILDFLLQTWKKRSGLPSSAHTTTI